MNFRQALGFFAVGAVFALIPNFAPGLLPANGAGSSSGAIWLQIMSLVQMGLGLSYFAQRTLVGLGSLLEYTPPATFATTRTVRLPRPVSFPRPALGAPALAPIRVAFKSGLLDQRRAA